MDFLRLTPSYDTRLWGGRTLKTLLGRDLPKGERIGESRELFDTGNESSETFFDGQKIGLHELIKKFPERIMGPRWDASQKFPVAAKLLDARQWLSLQVHPDAQTANALGHFAKSELWYFLDCDVNAPYVCGLKNGVNAESLFSKLESGDFWSVLRRFNASRGDSVFIEAGTLHSLGPGNVVLEIQYNSDTTYRLNDWNRPDEHGHTRELHVLNALRAIKSELRPEPQKDDFEKRAVLCSCGVFETERIRLCDGENITFEEGLYPSIISLVRGKLICKNQTIEGVCTILLPYESEFEFSAAENGTVFLRTKIF